MVAGLRSSRGASRRLVTAALNRRFELLLSVPLMVEYEAVMKRPLHLAVAGASAGDIDAILDALAPLVRG
jgi:PIN domain